uniref:WW domain-containing adapter protein with coiled-coil isoform X1 n=2 Tax=Myxine glutinosa TaxID=7769 RepID=UPI00358E6681
MVMYARKQPRLNDGYHERRESHGYQSGSKYPSKSQESTDTRNDKMRDSRDSSPASKLPRRSSSPIKEGAGFKGSLLQTHRSKEKTRGENVDASFQNHSRTSSNSHHAEPHRIQAAQGQDPADPWSEHISSSGKKYYYNCRTEVSQWEKPREWIEREQRQREAAGKAPVVANSFPRDRDYRREAMQVQQNVSSRCAGDGKQSAVPVHTVLSQTSRHNDRDYRLPRGDTTVVSGTAPSQATPISLKANPVSLGCSTTSPVSSSPFGLSSEQVKKISDANGALPLPRPQTSHSTGLLPRPEKRDAAVEKPLTSSSASAPSSSATSSRLTPGQAATPSQAGVALPSQDPAVLRQILPGLQTSPQLSPSLERLQEAFTQTISKILLAAAPNLLPQPKQTSQQAHQQSQSPMSLASDASSPRSHVSPRMSTPQTNVGTLKTHANLCQTKGLTPSKVTAGGQLSQPVTTTMEKPHQLSPESPNSQRHSGLCTSGTGGSSTAFPSSIAAAATVSATSSSTTNTLNLPLPSLCSLSPSLAAYFDENLVKHVQGWPAENTEKQAQKLQEESHNNSTQILDTCTDLKNARSLVRVCEIQATLREQRQDHGSNLPSICTLLYEKRLC